MVLGRPEQAVAVLRSYAEAGIEMVILNLRPPLSLAGLERFAHEVLPSVA